MPHIFISYAKKDTRALAIQLADALNAIEGVTAWVDRSLRAGQSWEVQIQAQIDRCDAMVVLYSPDINRHKQGQDESYVLTEIAYAKYTVRKLIIPVMAQRTEPPIALAAAHYIDFTLDGLTLDDLVQALCEEVGVVAAPEISPTPPTPTRVSEALKEQPAGDAPDFDSMSVEEVMEWMDSLAKRQTDEKPAPSTRASTSRSRKPRRAPNLPPEVIERARRKAAGEDVSTDAPKEASSEKKQGTLYQRIMDTTSKKNQSVKDILPPPFEWIEIPAGEFTMGHESQEDNPPRKVTLPTFWIAKYPVTNAQYAKFIEAGGYRERKWWTDAGWQVREVKNLTEPRRWNDHNFNSPEQPVNAVSWYEAFAFANWLKDVTGENVTLSTEAQWEKAARGTDGRVYPWGDTFDESRCNTRESGIRKTTPVRQYEGKGDSPYGVVDMAGNVWEWCLDEYINPQIDPSKVNLRSTDARVLRGGSFNNFRNYAAASCRFSYSPDYVLNSCGVRLVLSAP